MTNMKNLCCKFCDKTAQDLQKPLYFKMLQVFLFQIQQKNENWPQYTVYVGPAVVQKGPASGCWAWMWEGFFSFISREAILWYCQIKVFGGPVLENSSGHLFPYLPVVQRDPQPRWPTTVTAWSQILGRLEHTLGHEVQCEKVRYYVHFSQWNPPQTPVYNGRYGAWRGQL